MLTCSPRPGNKGLEASLTDGGLIGSPFLKHGLVKCVQAGVLGLVVLAELFDPVNGTGNAYGGEFLHQLKVGHVLPLPLDLAGAFGLFQCLDRLRGPLQVANAVALQVINTMD